MPSHGSGYAYEGDEAGLPENNLPVGTAPNWFLQPNLIVNPSSDRFEQEADSVADAVMKMPSRPDATEATSLGALQTYQIQPASLPTITPIQTTGGRNGAFEAPASFENRIGQMKGGGQRLPTTERKFFEPRFGVDFSRVRIHNNGSADTAARAVGAHAFTRGNNIVFRKDQYHPHTYAGRKLLAHELAHIVQQGAAPRIQHRTVNENGERQVQSNDLHMGMANHMVQRWPGDGMVPPGDCSWAKYLLLLGSVGTAKAVVSTLGRCSPGDSCLFMATKIAAISAEIAARVAREASCFKGGNTNHRKEITNKVNMLRRCYRFFTSSKCSPELIAAMAVVVESARAAIGGIAAVAAIALVVALIVAIIALAKVIAAALAAAAAAAAEAAAIAAAVTAVIALLVLIKDELSPDESSSA